MLRNDENLSRSSDVSVLTTWSLGHMDVLAETCNKFLKIEHHDSIVYSKHELIVTFLAGATSNLTVGNTTQEPLDQPA